MQVSICSSSFLPQKHSQHPVSSPRRCSAMPASGQRLNPATGRFEHPEPAEVSQLRSESPSWETSAFKRKRRVDTPRAADQAAGPEGAVKALVQAQRKVEQLTKAAARREGRAAAAKRKRRLSFGLRVVRKLWRQCGFAILLFMFLGVGKSNIMLAVGKASSAVVEVSNAAGNLAGAAANATVVLSDVAVDILLVATSALDEAVHGVDVLNTTASRCVHRSVGPLPPLVEWLRGGSNGSMPLLASQAMAVAVESQCATTQAMEVAREHFDVQGSYWHFRLKCRVRTDGMAAFSVGLVNVSFEAFWANPLWEHLGFRIDAEARKIIASLRAALSELEPISDAALAIDDSALQQALGVRAPAQWAAWSRRFARVAALLGAFGAAWQVRRSGWGSLWPRTALAWGLSWFSRRAHEVRVALQEAADEAHSTFGAADTEEGFVDLGSTSPQ